MLQIFLFRVILLGLITLYHRAISEELQLERDGKVRKCMLFICILAKSCIIPTLGVGREQEA